MEWQQGFLSSVLRDRMWCFVQTICQHAWILIMFHHDCKRYRLLLEWFFCMQWWIYIRVVSTSIPFNGAPSQTNTWSVYIYKSYSFRNVLKLISERNVCIWRCESVSSKRPHFKPKCLNLNSGHGYQSNYFEICMLIYVDIYIYI